MDYEGIPFKCGRCHCYGLLVAKHFLTNHKMIWTQKLNLSNDKDDLSRKDTNLKMMEIQGGNVISSCPIEAPSVFLTQSLDTSQLKDLMMETTNERKEDSLHLGKSTKSPSKSNF